MPKIRPAMTLEEFLQRPDIDEWPSKEFLDGRIEVKMSPEAPHAKLQVRLAAVLDNFANPRSLGEASFRPPPHGVLEGEPVLPGFRLPAAEVFGWLRRGR